MSNYHSHLSHLYVFLLVLLFPCLLQASSDTLFPDIRSRLRQVTPMSDEDRQLGVRLMQEIYRLAAKRKTAVPRPLFLAESLSSAGRMWYTNHNYTDRQLFAARDRWEQSGSQFKTAGHRITFDLMRKSGFDACDVFFYGEGARRYLENMKEVNPDLFLVPSLTPRGYSGPLNPGLLKQAALSPHTLKLDGKLLIVNWTWLDIPRTRAFIKEVEQHTGMPIAYIHSCGTIEGMDDPFYYWLSGRGVPATIILYWFDHLSSLLEVCAGIEAQNYLTENDGTLCARYYNHFLLPLFAAVCAQEPFNGKKLLAFQIMTGYNNFRSRQRLSHDGTQTLRSYLELCQKFKVDLAKAFEWDEYNEDSHFQPTVNKPMAIMRIMRYYTAKIKGLELEPLPQDDESLPNLIVSHKKQTVAGPDFKLEILNVPDRKKALPCRVRVHILNQDGVEVIPSRQIDFNGREIQAHDILIPTEKFIRHFILQPKLVIEWKGTTQTIQEGLPCTVVRPTVTDDSTWYSTPLRNVLLPSRQKVQFVNEKAKGLPEVLQLAARANLVFDEPLNSLEIVQDGRDTRFAYDPYNEFRQHDLHRRNIFLTMYYVEAPDHLAVEGNINIENAPTALWFEPQNDRRYKYLVDPTIRAAERAAAGQTNFKFRLSSWKTSRMFSFDVNELEKARFNITGKRMSGPNKGQTFNWQIPLRKLNKTGVVSTVLPDGIQIALELPQQMNHLPLPLKCREVCFSTRIRTGYPFGTFAMRAVSRSGKVWWSAPFCMQLGKSGQTGVISVFHDKKGPYDLKLDCSRIPQVNYRWTPDLAGNILSAPAGREFYGNVGGYDAVPTGYEGYHCSIYSVPRSFTKFRTADKRGGIVPKWEKQPDGSWCLAFSGTGDFIGFPPSLLPQRAGYTVSFDFLPQDVKRDQIYFTHEEHTVNGFRLRTSQERLVVDFYRRQAVENPRETVKTFTTGLRPLPDQWNHLEFKWDLRQVSVTLNGHTEQFPCSGIARFMAVSGFGGSGYLSSSKQPQYFKGKLRSFKVVHSARP